MKSLVSSLYSLQRQRQGSYQASSFSTTWIQEKVSQSTERKRLRSDRFASNKRTFSCPQRLDHPSHCGCNTICRNNHGRQTLSTRSFSSVVVSHNSSSDWDDTADSNVLAPLVVCGPMGIGTRRLIRDFINRDDNRQYFVPIVSHTTRPKRANEVDGVDYHFVSHSAMQDLMFDERLLEHAEIHGAIYGTSFEAIYQAHNSNHQWNKNHGTSANTKSVATTALVPHGSTAREIERIEILDMDMEGVKRMKRNEVKSAREVEIAADSGKRFAPIQAKYIFITPPSLHVLKASLLRRQEQQREQVDDPTHTSSFLQPSIHTILSHAEVEMKFGQTKAFDKRIVVDPTKDDASWDEAVDKFTETVRQWYRL